MENMKNILILSSGGMLQSGRSVRWAKRTIILLVFYLPFLYQPIYLLHGEMEGKVEFSQDLKREIANKSMTTNVCVVNKGTKISL